MGRPEMDTFRVFVPLVLVIDREITTCGGAGATIGVGALCLLLHWRPLGGRPQDGSDADRPTWAATR